ncbi:hypothetical protein MCOR10_010530 [Pyricularia oryzae]|nr:hypothetical protein MCOR01_006027 [Pyricularia oryzae]KAI6509928.1 hypothetical protein MCOR10_010530 [Pyricularia oryzae]
MYLFDFLIQLPEVLVIASLHREQQLRERRKTRALASYANCSSPWVDIVEGK